MAQKVPFSYLASRTVRIALGDSDGRCLGSSVAFPQRSARTCSSEQQLVRRVVCIRTLVCGNTEGVLIYYAFPIHP